MGGTAWKNADVAVERRWEHSLSAAQSAEIVEQARAAVARGVTAGSVAQEDMPLASLQDSLRAWRDEIADGLGFVLVHGFPVGVLDGAETEVAYVGMGQHLGRRVGQNSAGDLLTHIRDDRTPQTGVIKRLYRTRDRQDFHSDGADVIGLLCLHAAKSGGESKIVSSRAVLQEMMRRRPDLVDELRTKLCWDRQDDHLPGQQPWFELAPLFDLQGETRIFYVGWYIRNAQRHPQVPRLTERQLQAMELLESIANDPEFHLEMDFRPGDIQLLNNATILHSREEYEDFEEPERRRHLLRLWLAAHDFVSVEEGLRGGMGKVG